MSVRQYIGARYVPVFADPIEWNDTRTYEALTMVTYYNDTYISKKPVPTGTAITNTEYWALTGQYNAQLSDLSTQVGALNKLNINPYINTLLGKKILICGASNETNTLINGQKKWPAKMADMLNGIATVTTVAVGGADLADIITQVSNNVSAYDIIFICASNNDITHKTELGGPAHLTNTYWNNFVTLKTIIGNNPDKLFIIRGLPPSNPDRRVIYGKYPKAAYDNMCSVGALYTGAVFVTGDTFYGCVNDNNIDNVTYDGLHFVAPATDIAAYNAINICGYSVNNIGATFTELLKDRTIDGTPYNLATNLFTAGENISIYSGSVTVAFQQDYVIISIRLITSATIPADSIMLTVDEGFMSLFNLSTDPAAGSCVKLQSDHDNYGCLLINNDRSIRNSNEIPSGTGIRVKIQVPTEYATRGIVN